MFSHGSLPFSTMWNVLLKGLSRSANELSTAAAVDRARSGTAGPVARAAMLIMFGGDNYDDVGNRP
jgi:hypothetical protein